MPAFLDSRDLRYVIGALVLMVVLLVLTFALGPAPQQNSIGFPSTYARNGAARKPHTCCWII